MNYDIIHLKTDKITEIVYANGESPWFVKNDMYYSKEIIEHFHQKNYDDFFDFIEIYIVDNESSIEEGDWFIDRNGNIRVNDLRSGILQILNSDRKILYSTDEMINKNMNKNEIILFKALVDLYVDNNNYKKYKKY